MRRARTLLALLLALPPRVAAEDGQKQILFGDLHVHTTLSVDAFVFSLPVFDGEGVHPPADACDFARYCSGLDFFSINDHAEGLTPEAWQQTKDSIRQCNALAGDPEDPDLVAFMGWEWTQVGSTPETHYGHKNVLFLGTADDELPARPISSLSEEVLAQSPPLWLLRGVQGIRYLGLGEYADFMHLIQRLAETPNCAAGVDTRELPRDCRENAETPKALFAKLDQWGFDTIVIPHGLAWGVHAPPNASLRLPLLQGEHDPAREVLLEAFSGHGNGEEYRSFRSQRLAADGARICPEATPDFLPCCVRAGQIMRERCGELPEAECEERVAEAERRAMEAGTDPHLVFSDTDVEDWLDCDQCRDCFKPAFTLRPEQTAQYSLAVSTEQDPGRYRWGLIASTDNHTSRPGTGYKQYARHLMTDARGFASELAADVMAPAIFGRQADAQRAQSGVRNQRSFSSLLDTERVASFMYPGGIVAVHAEARDRRTIWRALKRREVYGTSGPRILLWFDLVNGPGAPSPMGSAVAMSETPRFRVRAAGAFAQRPGCPDAAHRGLSPERLERLCRGECQHAGSERLRIAAIEVVRVRPQQTPGEPVDGLIEDPWLRHECPPDPEGCTFSFEDPEHATGGRDSVYYVRVLQEATLAINADNYRTTFDAQGRAVRTDPCYGDYRTRFDDDCLALAQERAWSSPIFVDQP